MYRQGKYIYISNADCPVHPLQSTHKMWLHNRLVRVCAAPARAADAHLKRIWKHTYRQTYLLQDRQYQQHRLSSSKSSRPGSVQKKNRGQPWATHGTLRKKKGCMIFCRPRCDHIYMPPLYHGVTPSCCSKRSSTVAVESTEHANLPTVLECGSCRPCYIMCARVFMCTIPAS